MYLRGFAAPKLVIFINMFSLLDLLRGILVIVFFEMVTRTMIQ